jgi:outer membrane protein TolC
VFSNWTTREVKPLEAALSLEVSKKTKQDHLVITRQDSYRQALKILLLAKQYMYENQKLQIYIERVNMAKTRYASRNITEDDLAEAEYKVESKKLDLTNISQRTEAAGMELNKMLGRPLTASAIAVKDELTMEEFHTPDLDKLVSVSLEINTGVYTKDGELKAAQKLMELTEKLYKKGDLTYDINYYSLEAAKADLADVKRNLETQIRNKYNDLLTSKGKVEISQKYLQLLQKKLSAIDTKFKKGVESKDNLLSVKEQYIDAQYSYWSAVSDYDLALREFNDLLK